MPKMLCTKCEIEFKPEKNGVVIAELFQKNQDIYQLWEADLWKCPSCGVEVVAGFAQAPFAMHHSHPCGLILETLKERGRRIFYDRETYWSNP